MISTKLILLINARNVHNFLIKQKKIKYLEKVKREIGNLTYSFEMIFLEARYLRHTMALCVSSNDIQILFVYYSVNTVNMFVWVQFLTMCLVRSLENVFRWNVQVFSLQIADQMLYMLNLYLQLDIIQWLFQYVNFPLFFLYNKNEFKQTMSKR